MAKISKNASGIIVLLLSLIGLQVGEQAVMEVISSIGTIVSFVLLVWNQVARHDVTGFIFKK